MIDLKRIVGKRTVSDTDQHQIHHRAPIETRKSDWDRTADRGTDRGGKTKRSGHSNEKRSRGHTKPVRRVTRSRNGGLNTPETRVCVFATIVYLDLHKSTDPVGPIAQPLRLNLRGLHKFCV
ncbi:PREDICTED: uncharacterized protein LOC105558982 isoform X1 [Vollenhovia emeryi]|uniref:uncharacterized protein LOC105558982 isoform X1 n=1 Tax=Vollenhovia emeryi TaxID=411798 RepID=UPI0005F579FC|nr:PREDICTED: uncharacterized protein LOC105558982 isoform X1 [Vollenhovia emeryi]